MSVVGQNHGQGCYEDGMDGMQGIDEMDGMDGMDGMDAMPGMPGVDGVDAVCMWYGFDISGVCMRYGWLWMVLDGLRWVNDRVNM